MRINPQEIYAYERLLFLFFEYMKSANPSLKKYDIDLTGSERCG